MTPLVSLPMYPFPGGDSPTAHLGESLAEALRHRGFPARWEASPFATHEALEAHWLSEDLGLSQTCGLPLVEALAGRVDPVGTFLWAGVHTGTGHYRSLIVCRKQPGTSRRFRPAVNGFHSLSGWVSLGVFLKREGLGPRTALVTGSHRKSLEALARGDADVAAIDAVTWSLARRTSPEELAECEVIAEGPELPGLPLIAGSSGIPADVVQDAIFDALDQPSGRQAARSLGIEGFVVQRPEDFDAIPDLAREASLTLPRPGQFRRYA